MFYQLAVSFLCLLFFLQSCSATAFESTVQTPPAKANSPVSERADNSRSLPVMTTEQNQQLCQMTLDLPQLEGYFHPSAPNRKPLRVLINDVVKENFKLVKFGEPVQLINSAEAEKGDLPVFEFSSLEIKNETAKVVFRYRVEGITGTVDFKLEADQWKVVSQKITES